MIVLPKSHVKDAPPSTVKPTTTPKPPLPPLKDAAKPELSASQQKSEIKPADKPENRTSEADCYASADAPEHASQTRTAGGRRYYRETPLEEIVEERRHPESPAQWRHFDPHDGRALPHCESRWLRKPREQASECLPILP